MMSKIIFMNSSPDKSGNTFKIGEEILRDVPHDVLQMSDYEISQYGNVSDRDQISEIFNLLKDKEIIVMGSPVYWYTVGGILKTFIDRLYMLPEAEILRGKNLYFFAQGSDPDDGTVKTIEHLINRVATLMGMNLKKVVVDTSDGNNIKKSLRIDNK